MSQQWIIQKRIHPQSQSSDHLIKEVSLALSLSVNPKHFSNTQDSIKVVTEIVVPYVENQRKELQKPDQVALLILDVFHSQITEDVTSLLQKHNNLLVLVPNNMTEMFQPLDLMANKHCKTFHKNLFSE